ncbi:uncharacterized protein AMSG_09426 [Thecamonas trahens ATCC 50062]|uniref:Uncharacterized protein n=1 Tax=Thecamonas trahens ATCC 50062 TaxID=461836 RepID=A0A0L0DM87_THETB|nr:hypothetical protein AMSG_09426 [Thecamonas trahens ATCC 50062]KNC53121.1 hypothetical protein AMSG_09426 [Thecamonas trahens ATCC 50062]|eukprot:XP_013754788.1 hypothetical protein AMSG_09426 [Thecamonas trahens ATCC 50062]
MSTLQIGDMCWVENLAAGKVLAVSDSMVTVAPEWGELCPTCALKPEHTPAHRPAKVNVPLGNSADAGQLAVSVMDTSNAEGRADMMELADLAVGELMYNLRLRYKAQPMQFYTYVGDILVVVNPMADMGVSGEETKATYAGLPFRDASAPPHIYAVAEAAHKALAETAAPQVIVISGESGAGKTYATNDVLDFLAYRGSGCDPAPAPGPNAGAAPSPPGAEIVAKIRAISGVIEALGNAKTSRNHNSSRFGKLVKVQFDEAGAIEGAALQTYLLEKSRIVDQQPGERNYHIFYLMFQFLDRGERSARGLSDSVADYPYLVGSHGKNAKSWQYMPSDPSAPQAGLEPMADAKRWEAFIDAVVTLNLEDDLSCVWDTLAAILHLGTLTFEEHAGSSTGFCTVSPPGVVSRIAGLLAVDADALATNLLSCEVVNMRRAYRPDKAKQTADALAKLLYASLFDVIIEHINASIKTGFTRRWIGVLDIFGFESFQSLPDKHGVPDTANRFEQLCINLTNERLQRFFYDQLIPKQLAHYADHGLDVDAIEYDDNTLCVNLIMEGRKSLFGALNNATKEAATLPAFRNNPELAERRWVETIKSTYKGGKGRLAPSTVVRKSSPDEFVGWFDDKLDSRAHTQFAVHHYAETVWYTVDGCVEKNADKIAPELVTLVSSSSAAFVAGLFDPDRLELNTSVADKFAEQLRALVSPASWNVPGHPSGMLDLAAEPFFVRCVKPICSRVPGMPRAPLSNHKVLDQLRSAGMYAVIQMRLAGYASEVDKAQFVETYTELVDDMAAFNSLSLDNQVRSICASVVASTQHDLTSESGMAPYQIGNSNLVFLKDAMNYALRDALAAARAARAAKQALALSHFAALFSMWSVRQSMPRLVQVYEQNQERLEFIRTRIEGGASEAEAKAAWDAELATRAAAMEAEYKLEHFIPLQKAAAAEPVDKLDAAIANMLKDEPAGEARAALEARRKALKASAKAVNAALAALEADVYNAEAETAAADAIADLDAVVLAEEAAYAEDVKRREAAAAAAAEAAYIATHVTSVETAANAVPFAKVKAALTAFGKRHANILGKRENLESALHAHGASLDDARAALEARLDELRASPHSDEVQAGVATALSALEVLVGGVHEFLRLMEERVAMAAAAEEAKERKREARRRKREAREARKRKLLEARQAMLSAQERVAAERAAERKRQEEAKKRAVKLLKKKQKRRLRWFETASVAMDGLRVLFHHAEATVRYLGPLPSASVNLLTAPYYIGLEMPYPSDLFNSGDYEGTQLFECSPEHGMFVAQDLVSVLVASDELRAGERHLQVGDRVWRRNHVPLQTGVIMYYGETHFDEGPFVGIALDQAGSGTNSGRVHGFKYFKCAKDSGLFLRPEELERIEPWSHSVVKERTNEYMILNDIYLDDDEYSEYDGDEEDGTSSRASSRPASGDDSSSGAVSETVLDAMDPDELYALAGGDAMLTDGASEPLSSGVRLKKSRLSRRGSGAGRSMSMRNVETARSGHLVPPMQRAASSRNRMRRR